MRAAVVYQNLDYGQDECAPEDVQAEEEHHGCPDGGAVCGKGGGGGGGEGGEEGCEEVDEGEGAEGAAEGGQDAEGVDDAAVDSELGAEAEEADYAWGVGCVGCVVLICVGE